MDGIPIVYGPYKVFMLRTVYVTVSITYAVSLICVYERYTNRIRLRILVYMNENLILYCIRSVYRSYVYGAIYGDHI